MNQAVVIGGCDRQMVISMIIADLPSRLKEGMCMLRISMSGSGVATPVEEYDSEAKFRCAHQRADQETFSRQKSCGESDVFVLVRDGRLEYVPAV